MTDVRELMEEPIGGENHGRAASNDPQEEGRLLPLDVVSMKTDDLMEEGGFSVIETAHGHGLGRTYGARDMGMTAHRGVLQDDEYVDPFVLRAAVEAELGYTYSEVSEAYKSGRPTAERRQLREKVDARILALSRAGGNMAILAKALDLSEKTVDRALARARLDEVVPIVKHPTVTHSLTCFITAELGAERHKRRFSKSPREFVGTINLLASEREKGFETEPGNPAYWHFRRHGRRP